MFNVCPKCGIYHDDKIIEPEGPFAVCPSCGHKHRFKQLPLFVVTGASGVGKSTICIELSSSMTEVVFIDVDMLWRDEFNTPENDFYEFRNLCLRVAKNFSQGGKSIVLCGSSIPSQYERCVERRYFKDIHYLALVCDDDIIRDRLMKRPAITLLDTSCDPVETSVEKVSLWIKSKIE